MIEPEAHIDVLDCRTIALFKATLAGFLFEVPEETAPLGSHWCLFPPLRKTMELAQDGHPPRSCPVSVDEFPRRMWVGGSLSFQSSFRIGSAIRRSSEPQEPTTKSGRSGSLVLTGAVHDYKAGEELILRERQDLVFRSARQSEGPSLRSSVGPKGDLIWEVATTPALLFRYSAITFNAHRIHYDVEYAHSVEGYSDILVQGPLQATLLLNLAASLLGRAPTRFDYRALAPLPAKEGALAVGSRAPDGSIACFIHAIDGRETMEAFATAAA